MTKTSAQAIKLGPFVGGINSASDPTFISDTEVVDCVNFDLDLDGSLLGRPPIVETTNNSGSWSERIVLIGRATLAGVNYVIGSNASGTYAYDGTTWSTIQAGLVSQCALQYLDVLYVIPAPSSSVAGGYWTGAAWNSDANMPKGESAVFFRARLLVLPGVAATSNKSRVWFSGIITTSAALSWTPATDFFDVQPGDGTSLVDVEVADDQLLLFKQDSTYLMDFQDTPLNGILRVVNSTIGATTRRCTASFENSTFVFHEGTVYEIANLNFDPINIRVPFYYDTTTPSARAEEVFLSVFGTKLLVKYFNRTYSYNLRTKTWSRWSSQATELHNFGPLVAMPSNPTAFQNTKYFCGSAISSSKKFFYIQDGYDSTTKETTLSPTTYYPIGCSVETKTFDFDDQLHYKKLFWWGLDGLGSSVVSGTVQPVTTNYQVTWTDLSVYTWAQVTGTWDNPLTNIPPTVTTITTNSAPVRQFIRFAKTLRFRQVFFTAYLEYDGTTVTGPVRVFTLTAIVGAKETVSKQVT